MALCALGVREAKFNSMLELRLTPPAITGGGGRVVVVVGFFNLLNFVLTWPDVVVVVTCLNVMIAVVGCLVDAGAGAEVVEPPERSDVAPETPENARELTRTASATTVTTPPATTRRRWTGVAR